MIERREVGLGRTRGLYRQFQARDEEECWIAIYRMQKEKKQPHWRHLKATFSCRSDGSGYCGIMFKCLNDGNLLDSLRPQGTCLISVARVFLWYYLHVECTADEVTKRGAESRKKVMRHAYTHTQSQILNK